MIIDNHIHLVGAGRSFADLSDKIARIGDVINLNTRHPEFYQARLTEEPVDFSDGLIADFDRHGIDKGLVQQTPGRGTNDLVSDSTQKHAGRLFGLIGLGGFTPMQRRAIDPWDHSVEQEGLAAARAWAAAEIERCADMAGMVGIAETHAESFTVETHPERIAQDFRPIMDMAARYRLPIQFPTGWSQFPGGLFYADPVWTDEIAGRYPEVPIVLNKMGRGLHHFDTALSIAMRNTNVYFDTVGTIGEHVRIAVDTIGADRIMFGSDWSPTWRWLSDPTDLYTMRKKTLDDANLTPSEREQIEWRTAARVYGLKLD